MQQQAKWNVSSSIKDKLKHLKAHTDIPVECNNRQNGTFHPQLKDKLKHLKAHTDIPVVAGFGIRTKEHIKDLATVADGGHW